MRRPKVTVVLPVFNGEKYLREAVDSILNQTYTDFELLVIDDGSTDSSAAIVNAYNDRRVKLVQSSKNRGIAAALNIGIDLAGGEYMARMDSDDISLPERLANQVEFMEANPEYGLCGTNVRSINSEGKIITPPWWSKTPAPLEWILLWDNPVAHPTAVMRMAALRQFNLRYRMIPDEDGDLWSRLALKARIARLPEVLLHYRYRPDGAFNTRKNEHIRQAIASSRELARAIAGREAPAFHRYLTVYPRALGERPLPCDRKAAAGWVNLLLKKARKHWRWDAERYGHALTDGRKRLKRYFSTITAHP
ncbi:MAG: glycosyltransferase [Bacillota bacterium]